MQSKKIKYFLLTLLNITNNIYRCNKILYAVIRYHHYGKYKIVGSIVFDGDRVTYDEDKGKYTALNNPAWNIKEITKNEYFIHCI